MLYFLYEDTKEYWILSKEELTFMSHKYESTNNFALFPENILFVISGWKFNIIKDFRKRPVYWYFRFYLIVLASYSLL